MSTSLVSAVHGLAIAAMGIAALTGCASSASEASDSGDSELSRAPVEPLAAYPSTLALQFSNGNCTGTKVGPAHILTAAHCVDAVDGSLDWAAKPGASLVLRTAAAPAGLTYTIARVEVHPDRLATCRDAGCPRDSLAMKSRDQPDVALIVVREPIADVPSATIDTTPVAVGSPVVLAGFGCTSDAFGRRTTDGNLRAKVATTQPSSVIGHWGSGVDGASSALHAGSYLFTLGAAASRDAPSLCSGDSGGPLYRRDGAALFVVGINSSYTFRPIESLSVTNWHTRLDTASHFGVAAWLMSLGLPQASFRTEK